MRRNEKTVKLTKYIDVTDMIIEDKTNSIKRLINERICKETILKYVTISKYTLLTVSTCLIFLSSWLEDKDIAKTLTIIAGCSNAIVMWWDKINDAIINKMKRIKKELNQKIEHIKKPHYVSDWQENL